MSENNLVSSSENSSSQNGNLLKLTGKDFLLQNTDAKDSVT